MKKVSQIMLLFVACVFATSAFAQKPFTNCAAAFLNNKMVVDEYSPTGKCALAANATGTLTVCTADISPNTTLPVDKIGFKIAIRDKNTGTLLLFSDKTYKQVDISTVLAKCQQGDHIILLTLNNEFALPHNEILIK